MTVIDCAATVRERGRQLRHCFGLITHGFFFFFFFIFLFLFLFLSCAATKNFSPAPSCFLSLSSSFKLCTGPPCMTHTRRETYATSYRHCLARHPDGMHVQFTGGTCAGQGHRQLFGRLQSLSSPDTVSEGGGGGRWGEHGERKRRGRRCPGG